MPKIYVFCNRRNCDGLGDWHPGTAIAEDGTVLAGHLSSSHSFLKSDLGNKRLGFNGFSRDEEYDKHYPDGYEVVWIEGDEVERVLATLPKPDAVPTHDVAAGR